MFLTAQSIIKVIPTINCIKEIYLHRVGQVAMSLILWKMILTDLS